MKLFELSVSEVITGPVGTKETFSFHFDHVDCDFMDVTLFDDINGDLTMIRSQLGISLIINLITNASVD